MEYEIVKKEKFDIKYLDAFVGGRVYAEDIEINGNRFEDIEEIFTEYPTLKGNNGYEAEIFLRINVETGHVDNWPVNKTGNFETVKVVDEGIYILRDNELNEVHKYSGYVPDCLDIERNGYGDYWEFKINKKGFIENWKFEENDINKLFGINN